MPTNPVMPLDDPDGLHERPHDYATYAAIQGDNQDPAAASATNLLASLTGAPKVAGRTALEACVWARGQSERPSQSWLGLCLAFVHEALDIPALFPTAIAAWWGADPDSRHPDTNADDAIHGHPFVWAGGSKGFGHIDLPAWAFPGGRPGAWSNDLVREGQIDKVDRNAPQTVWGQRPKGWLDELNGYDLQTGKPKQNKPYLALEAAIHNIGTALDTAEHQHDTHDIKVLTAEMHRLQRLAHTLKHA